MHNEDQRKVITVVIGIMVSVSALVWAMLGPAIKQTIFMPRDAFFFGTEGTSVLLSMAGLFVLGVSIVLLAIAFKNKKLKWGLFSSLLVISLGLLVVSFDDYFYYTPKGIHNNNLTSIGTKVTEWDDVASLTSVYVKDESGRQSPQSLIFELKNGEKIIRTLSGQLILARDQISDTLMAMGGKSIIQILDAKGNVLEEYSDM